MRLAISLTLTLACAAAPPAPAPTAAKTSFDLSVDNIMRGPGLYGYEPTGLRWSGTGDKLYFEWKQASEPVLKDTDTYVVDGDGTHLRKLSEDEAKLAPPAARGFGGAPELSADAKLQVFAEHGDIYIYDRTNNTRRRLTHTTEPETAPHFTRDGRHVTFVRAANLYKLSLTDGTLEQLTDIRAAGGPGGGPGFGAAATNSDEEKKGTASQETVKREQRALLDIVAQRATRREEETAERKRDNPRKPLTLAPRQMAQGVWLAPDESYVVVAVSTPGADAKNTIVPNYVTESGYTEDIPSRTKVGDTLPASRMALVRVDTGAVTWIDTGNGEKAAEKKPDDKGASKKETKTNEIALSAPRWSDDGTKLVINGRSADNKDRYLYAVDATTGKTRVLMHLHDDAWVSGGWGAAASSGWLADNARYYYLSEADGWSHLYTVDYATGETKQLTKGQWEVKSVELARDKRTFYLTTSEASLHEQRVYTMSVDGGARTCLTAEAGLSHAVASPDEKRLAVIHSYANRPPELFLMDNRAGAPMQRITTSPAKDFNDYAWTDPPIVQVPASDGAMIPARLYKPANWRAGGAAVIFVHGAGYLQNVHRGWSQYAHEYLFHHLLMQRGFMVIDLDYRASAGYGRDWRTAIYRYMGGRDLNDHVDAALYLVTQHGVDPNRIGLYGGSYGGFITLMAMFTRPGTFASGAALRPVTDWAHYNHGYTADILNAPQSDEQAYKRSSPIYFADGLKGALLICHGVVDTNVHFQDSVRLAQRLIELRKDNWELAMFPAEDHGFVQPTSWADEYKRILKLFMTTLQPDKHTASVAH